MECSSKILECLSKVLHLWWSLACHASNPFHLNKSATAGFRGRTGRRRGSGQKQGSLGGGNGREERWGWVCQEQRPRAVNLTRARHQLLQKPPLTPSLLPLIYSSAPSPPFTLPLLPHAHTVHLELERGPVLHICIKYMFHD